MLRHRLNQIVVTQHREPARTPSNSQRSAQLLQSWSFPFDRRVGGSPVALHILVLHVAEGQRRHLHHRRQPLPHRHLATPTCSVPAHKKAPTRLAHQVDLVRIHFDVDPVAAVSPSRGDLDTSRRWRVRRRRRGSTPQPRACSPRLRGRRPLPCAGLSPRLSATRSILVLWWGRRRLPLPRSSLLDQAISLPPDLRTVPHTCEAQIVPELRLRQLQQRLAIHFVLQERGRAAAQLDRAEPGADLVDGRGRRVAAQAAGGLGGGLRPPLFLLG